jgi:hypothetical protein
MQTFDASPCLPGDLIGAELSDKTLKLYDGHVHDLLNDVDKGMVMADIADIKEWIGARLSSAIKEAVR